jgi:hypothetical protein
VRRSTADQGRDCEEAADEIERLSEDLNEEKRYVEFITGRLNKQEMAEEENKPLPRYVYLLWDHCEDGPEHMLATLDIDALPSMADSLNGDGWFARGGEPDLVRDLTAMLPSLRDTPQTVGLMRGWGGLHVQVVELSTLSGHNVP